MLHANFLISVFHRFHLNGFSLSPRLAVYLNFSFIFPTVVRTRALKLRCDLPGTCQTLIQAALENSKCICWTKRNIGPRRVLTTQPEVVNFAVQ